MTDAGKQVQQRTVSFSKHAINIFFHLLTQCNLSCTHCYINPDQHGKKSLSIETITRWLLAFEKKREANLIFLGGEPTLHPNLKDAVKLSREMGFKSITIDTNGYLFHNILSHITPDDVDFISFSLDGSSPLTNDPLRGEGCFLACTSGIKKAKSLGFKTSLIYTVSQKNLHDLENMPSLLKTLSIDHFFIQIIGIRGKSAHCPSGTTSSSQLQISRQQWNSIIPRVAERVAELGIDVTYPKVFIEPSIPFECAGIVADNYFIFPNGRVYRCPLCEDYPLHSLYIEDNTLKKSPPINESDLFDLDIPEGCVMNRIIQPCNIEYDRNGKPLYRIACCLLKVHVEKKK